MKKIALSLLILINFFVASAQLKEYQSAVQYYKWGDYDKAKEAIDKAVTNDKTKDEPKTWWYKGLIYHALYLSKDKSFKSLVPINCPDIILESYKKALLLDLKDPQYHNLDIENKEDDQLTFFKLINDIKTKYIDEELLTDILTNKFPSLASIFFLRGAKEYDEEKAYAKALKTFESSIFISSLSGKVDTITIYTAAMSADKSENYKKACFYYKQVTQLRYGKNDNERASYWIKLAKTYINQTDTVNYLKTLKTGIEKYPKSNVALLIEIVNYYISSRKITDALNYMKIAVQKDPQNVNLVYSQGTLYDKIDSTERAITCYKKAISIDSTKTDILYSLGSCYFNKGVEYIDMANKLDTKEEQKYKEYSAKAIECFKNALPYYEKAHSSNPKDFDVLTGLKLCYYKLNMKDKYEATKKEIDGLKK